MNGGNKAKRANGRLPVNGRVIENAARATGGGVVEVRPMETTTAPMPADPKDVTREAKANGSGKDTPTST